MLLCCSMDIILTGCMDGLCYHTRPSRRLGTCELTVTVKPMPTTRYFCVLGINGGPVNTVFYNILRVETKKNQLYLL
jgi:hypothetical protein